MKYIWINPVAENMYTREALGCFLKKHGLIQVRCNKDWELLLGRNTKLRSGRARIQWLICGALWQAGWQRITCMGRENTALESQSGETRS
ncbi:MAG: hypothetical protein ACLTBV_23520 [Enterocloster bolteae]